MKFAVNYSPVLGDLVKAGQIDLDVYKCPAWPDLFPQAQATRPVYIHFPLAVGSGQGGPVDEEQHCLANLDRVAGMLAQTGTPLVNTHLIIRASDYSDVDPDRSTGPQMIERVVSNVLRDLEPLITRFGAERVTVENVINDFGYLTTGVVPEVIHQILDQTGCGFLFDLSHARLTARNLGIDERSYIAELPVDRVREIHVTGLQRLEGDLLDRLEASGDASWLAERMAGKWIDHLPMTEPDWAAMAWMMAEIGCGRWQAPWVIAFEFGGVGGFWEMISERSVYEAQLPRMAALIRGR